MALSSDSKNWIEVRYAGHSAPPERRAYHATFLHGNKVYIHGGEDLAEGILGNMWSLDLNFINNANPMWSSVQY
jgi:hypothetical protein